MIQAYDARFENEAEFVRSAGGEIWPPKGPRADRRRTHFGALERARAGRTIKNDASVYDLAERVAPF